MTFNAKEIADWIIEGHDEAHGLTDHLELHRRIVAKLNEAHAAGLSEGLAQGRAEENEECAKVAANCNQAHSCEGAFVANLIRQRMSGKEKSE